jgi:hypothetical protein
MAHYQLSHLDLSTRMELAVRMLDPHRPWGEVTQMARKYGTSRKFLYELRDRLAQVLAGSLAPQQPGPKAVPTWLYIDQQFLQRAILTLSLLPPSLRNLQLVLQLLFGQHCSLGYLQHTLRAAGERAQAENQRLQPAQPILGEADEIYKAHRPCLTVLDGRSLLVLNLAAQSDCDRTTWGVTLLDLQQRGVCFEDLALDGSQNLRAAIRDAQLSCPLRPDLFHIYQAGHEIRHKLKWLADQAGQVLQQAQKAEQEAQSGKRFQGRPRTKPLSLTSAQAQAQAEEALRQYELWVWLFAELRQALHYIRREGQLQDPQRASQDLDLILEWMQSLSARRVPGFARNLVSLRQELLAPLKALVQRLAVWRQNLDPQWEAFILWAWKHRQALQIEIERDFPVALHPIVQAFWEALADFHRTSSLAEAFHSWLRPFLELHRSLPAWLLALLQAFWNHHPFQRGKRQGHSPLALAGIQPGLSLSAWIDQLLAPDQQAADTSRCLFKVQEKCYPISLYL